MSLLWVTATSKPVTRYVDHHELGQMYSGDYDEKMKDLPHDSMFREQEHPAYADLPAGGRGPKALQHVDRLARDIRQNGIREPIEVRGENVVYDGHHRALAAMKLRMGKIPIHDFA